MNNKNKIECLECGKFFKHITSTHLKKCCGFTVSQYRNKYSDIIMRIFTYEHKERLSEIQKGKNHTEETKQKIGRTNEGKKHTEEANKRCSEKLKGRKLSEKHKEKIKIAVKKPYENGKIHPMKGKKHTEESKQNMKIAVKKTYENGRETWNKGKNDIYSEEALIQMRISRIKDIKKKYGIAYPNFSLEACAFFDWLNKEFNLNGQHALNGGEYHIKELGYFVDYYEPELNVVLEWDEEGHYNSDGKLRDRDIRRQKEIEAHLECEFIRINENKSNWQLLPMEAVENIFYVLED